MSKFGRWSTGSLAKAKTQEEYDRILLTVPRKKGAGCRLADFGYFYNENFQLRQIAKPDEPFAWLGQLAYDYLGEAVVEEIYTIMEEKFGLKRIMLPIGPDSGRVPPVRSTPENPRIPIFVSPNFTTCETLVVICQGVGAVRPGMWARSLCINNSLEDGCIFSYLRFCQQQGWGVIVCNPNENSFSPIAVSAAVDSAQTATKKNSKNDDESEAKAAENEEKPNQQPQQPQKLDDETGDFWLSTPDSQWKTTLAKALRSGKSVEGSEQQEDHGCYIWANYVIPSAAKEVYIVAHSYGGKVSTAIIDEFFDDPSIKNRLAAVAWTDAINDNFRNSERSSVNPLRAWLRKHSRNYIASDQPLGTPIKSREGYDEVSSGHKVHEWTSATCAPHLFNWLLQKHEEFLANKSTENKKTSDAAQGAEKQ